MENNKKWQVTANVQLLWQVWGDEHILYHVGSADTHLLTPAAASVVCSLQEKPKTIDELADMLSTINDASGDMQVISLEEVIRQLKQLCLIEVSHS